MEYLRDFCKEKNIDFSEKQSGQIKEFIRLLLDRNKVVNLTAIVDPVEVEIKHIIDSIEGVKIIRNLVSEEFSLLDVGCGAGFPGIPLKIFLLQGRFTLLDSLKKRIEFVNDVIRRLELQDIEAVAVRAEDYKKKSSFDICVSRAVAKTNVLLEYSLPFVKEGGYCILYKSQEFEEELKEAETAINELGGKLFRVETFSLPNNNGKRSLIIIKKIKKTPEKYPRRAGKPSKSPIR
ncbi:MAG: 16S rRNA (guanine(527)-N(7))-methyltransferase RsmG [Lachnospiraceae bacterium]